MAARKGYNEMNIVTKWRIERFCKKIPQLLKDLLAGLTGGIIGFLVVILMVLGGIYLYDRFNQ